MYPTIFFHKESYAIPKDKYKQWIYKLAEEDLVYQLIIAIDFSDTE